MKIRFGDCPVCKIWEDQMALTRQSCDSTVKNWADRCKYLEFQIALARKDWQEEREEYKRAIDRLLTEKKIAPVGQGVPEIQGKDIKIEDFVGIFKEDV